MPSSQKDSHRNSVQNAMIGEFTALTVTVSVTTVVFTSWGHFSGTFWINFVQLSDNLGAAFGQLLGSFRATFGQRMSGPENLYCCIVFYINSARDPPILCGSGAPTDCQGLELNICSRGEALVRVAIGGIGVFY